MTAAAQFTTRIVYDGTIFTSQVDGGISRYFRKLIEEAAQLRPEWLFDMHIVDDGGVHAALPSGENIRITKRKHMRPGWCCLPMNYASRQSQIRRVQPSIIHLTLARPFHFAPCPLVTTIHDAIIEKLPEFYKDHRHARTKRWWRWSAKFSDAILTVSNTSRSDILSVWDPTPSKVHVTYPGVEEVFSKPNREEVAAVLMVFGIRRPYVLYVGHRGEHKNFSVVAEAMQNPALDALDIVLVGGAEDVPELRGWQEVGQRRLHHLKGLSDRQLCCLYARAAALVFPSIYEGFGFPLVEAMSCGAPVVASDIPSSREVCDDAAEFFGPRDPADCRQAILRIQENDRRNRLIAKGLERVRRFNWTSCAAATVAVYEELMNRQSAVAKRRAA